MITSLTQERESRIGEYVQRGLAGVFDGGRYNAFRKDDAEAYIHWIYEFCGFEKPQVIVASNPYEAQLLANILSGSYSQLDSLLISQLHSQLDSQLDSQLISQLHSQLDSQLISQLHSQLDSQLISQLHSQLDSQLWLQLHSQLDSQLILQLHSQLDSQLHSQLHSQLDSQLWLQLGGQSLSYFEDRLFLVGIYGEPYVSYCSYLHEVLGLRGAITPVLEQMIELHRKSNIFSAIYFDKFCIVSKYPKKIYRDDAGRLHNVHGSCIDWESTSVEWKNYFIRGREMPERIFTEPITREAFLSEQDEDVRAGMYEIVELNGEGSMCKLLGASVIDERSFVHRNGEIETMRLYRTAEKYAGEVDLNGNTPSFLAWLEMECPSTGQKYLIPTDGSFDNCLDAAKYARPGIVPQTLGYEWSQRT